MIRDIEARSLLGTITHPAAWFGVRYNMNLYRGCQHACIYCDSRSECYQIDNFDDLLVKANAIELLDRELARKRRHDAVGTGSMGDPYTPHERERRLTRAALEVILRRGFPVHITTKSDLVTRDIDLLREIARDRASVAITITTADDALAAKLEPGAPAPSARLSALRTLADAGIFTGVLLMPVLPFVEDTYENVREVVSKAAEAGVRFIIAGFSVTMRDRQREYYLTRIERIVPGTRRRYEETYGDAYSCKAPGARDLCAVFEANCAARQILTSMEAVVAALPSRQLRLF